MLRIRTAAGAPWRTSKDMAMGKGESSENLQTGGE